MVQRLALANQLRALLESFWPGAAAVFAEIDSPIALAFVRRYPTPDSAAHLGEKRMKAFTAQHRYSGRRSVGELLERLRRAPTGLAGDSETDAKGELAQALATLVAIRTQIDQLSSRISSRIEHAIAEMPDGEIVMSFPRAVAGALSRFFAGR